MTYFSFDYNWKHTFVLAKYLIANYYGICTVTSRFAGHLIRLWLWINLASQGPHTSIFFFCKTACKQPLQLWFYTNAENEQWAARLQPKYTLSISGQGLSDHHYRLHSVGLCAELQSFAILWGNRGIWHRLSLRTGQSKYTVLTLFQVLILVSPEQQDEKQARKERRRRPNLLLSSLTAYLKGDCSIFPSNREVFQTPFLEIMSQIN